MSGRNDYYSDLDRMEAWLKKNSQTECAAVFDIGTRAARVLVGPKNPPEAELWTDKLFITVGFVPKIGADVSPYSHILNVDDSPALKKLRSFIIDVMNVLHRCRVSDSNIAAIGTEVFRAMPDSNRAEVIAWIEQQTGLRLDVINGEEEAGLSLWAVNFTYKLGLNNSLLHLDEENQAPLLLIDQGGGSTEISFNESGTTATLDSKPTLGTTTLSRMFFGGVASKDPKSNYLPITEQYQLILPHIQERVDKFKALRPGAFKLAYGLGTAITDCIPGLRKSEIHNKVLTTEMIVGVESQRCSDLTARYPNVAALWEELERIKRNDPDRHVRVDKEALFLYGLPVFRMILEKAGFSELRLCGYPLRYGAFLAWHKYERNWEGNPRTRPQQ